MTPDEINRLWQLSMNDSEGMRLGFKTQQHYFAALVAAAERNTLAAWMIQFGFATGHGDTMEQLVDALGSEIVDRIECEIDTEREACAKVCENGHFLHDEAADARFGKACAAAIRARSNDAA